MDAGAHADQEQEEGEQSDDEVTVTLQLLSRAEMPPAEAPHPQVTERERPWGCLAGVFAASW